MDVNANNEPTVFIVDDHRGVRKSYRLLAESSGLRVEEFGSATDFLNQFDENRSGCLILDVQMPEMTGPELQHRLNATGVRIPIIFVSAHADVPMVTDAFRSGAVHFLEKPVNGQHLRDIIQQAIQQDRVYRCETAKQREVQARLSKLTPKQREVLDLIVAGRSIKQIAIDLSISHQTAAKHRTSALEAMAVMNEVELIRLINGLDKS